MQRPGGRGCKLIGYPLLTLSLLPSWTMSKKNVEFVTVASCVPCALNKLQRDPMTVLPDVKL